MKFEQALEEGILMKQFGGLILAAGILLFSLGIKKQNDNLAIAKEFLIQHPTYIEKLNDLKNVDRFDKVTRNKVVNQWKAFVSKKDLNPKLASGLKIVGTGKLAIRNK